MKIALACLTLSIACWAAPPARHAPNAKHVAASVTCENCHGEATPSKAAPMKACIGCHGDFATVAVLTKALPVNPHDSHMDDPDCTECHFQHKAPVVKCLSCHATFKFTAK